MSIDKNKNGKFVVIVGPSGTGKSTMLNMLVKKYSNFEFSISATTRKPREGEKNAIDYFFITKEEFKKKIINNDFFEYAIYSDNYYGTLKEPIYNSINNNKIIFSDIDYQGMLQVQKILPKENLITIFFMPPSIDKLIERIKNRANISENELNNRIQVINTELEHTNKADYIFTPIHNDINKSFELFEELILNLLK